MLPTIKSLCSQGLRIVLAGVLCLALGAQNNTQPPEPKISVTVTQIVVPVTVHDRDGNIVNGLQPRQFHLTDNGKDQDIAVDVSYHPISLVIALQANAGVEAILPQVKKIGPLLESFIVGDQGEAALMTFDHRFMVKQEFTNDGTLITAALKKVTAGSSSSRLVDAIDEGVRMLRTRPANRRRVLLLVSETRDYGSEGKLRNAMIDAQVSNVSVYTINISRMVASLTGKPQPGRPDPLPPAAHPMPSNVPATPTTVMQKGNNPNNSADFIPLMVEILRDVKAVFKDNPAEALTKATGGQEFSFFKQRGLEDAIEKIGSELHSQYIITYNPNNKDEGGFHEIKVTLNRPELKVRSRPGYWLATVQ